MTPLSESTGGGGWGGWGVGGVGGVGGGGGRGGRGGRGGKGLTSIGVPRQYVYIYTFAQGIPLSVTSFQPQWSCIIVVGGSDFGEWTASKDFGNPSNWYCPKI